MFMARFRTVSVGLLGLLLLLAIGCAPSRQSDYLQGITALEERNFSEAARHFEAAVLNNDHEADAHLQLGILYERQPDKVCLAVWHYRAYLAFLNRMD